MPIAKQGPGLAYRKGPSLPELIRLFPDDATAEQWFADTRWPDGPQCPNCGSWRIQSGAAHKTMPYRCRECRKRFSVRSKTVMAESKLGFQVWILAIYLLTTGIKGTSSNYTATLASRRRRHGTWRTVFVPCGKLVIFFWPAPWKPTKLISAARKPTSTKAASSTQDGALSAKYPLLASKTELLRRFERK